MTHPPESPASNQATRAGSETIEKLEREITALRKTNTVLKRQAADSFGDSTSPFARVEQQAHLDLPRFGGRLSYAATVAAH